MSKKILLTFKPDQMAIVDEMMKEDTATNRTAFFVRLVSDEKKRRDIEKNKRTVGRPRKEEPEEEAEPDYTDDLPKNIYHMGIKVGKREWDDIQERSKHLKSMGL